MNENDLSYSVIGNAIEVHKTLGPGLLESAYEECLDYKLRKAGLLVERQKPIPVVFEEVRLECGYRIDLLVENKLVVEIKSVESLHNVHFAQVLTYLRFGAYKLGLVINFNVERLQSGIKRIVNGRID